MQGEEKEWDRRKQVFRTKDSSPQRQLRSLLPLNLLTLSTPTLHLPPFLPSASCFHTRPRLYPLSLLGIHGKKLPFLSEPQRTVSTALLTTTPHELLSPKLHPRDILNLSACLWPSLLSRGPVTPAHPLSSSPS